MRPRVLVAIGLVLAAGCGADDPDDGVTTRTESTAGTPVRNATVDATVAGTGAATGTAEGVGRTATPIRLVDIDDAVAVNVATNGTGAPVLAWTEHDAVQIARLNPDSFTLGTRIVISGELEPIAHQIERPAISIGPDGIVHAAFTSAVGTGGTVQYVDLVGDTPTTPLRISGEPRPETNLVHMTLGDDAPTLAWLEDSTLSVAPPREGAPAEIEEVDDLTCDCCNPAPIRLGDRLVVAYRNLERTDDGVIRDVYATTTGDDGATFSDPVPVADDHWFLDGCPFSGPAVAQVDDALIVAWMDGRQSRHPDQDGTTIWVDRSSDGGATFGTDVALTDDGIHRWPMLTVDTAGTTHLVWETQSGDAGGITYSRSIDGGITFDPPTVLLPDTDDSGPRRAPSVVAHGEHLLVTWTDRDGGHLAVFTIADLPR